MRRSLTSAIRPHPQSIVPFVAMLISACAGARAQVVGQGDHAMASKWTVSIVGGAYLRATTASAVSALFEQNNYGFTIQPHGANGFFGDYSCSAEVTYPTVTDQQKLGWLLGVRRALRGRYSVEMLAATEPNATVGGYCGIVKAPSCVSGPALSIEHWNGSKKYLNGIWLDASTSLSPWILARAQYRRYGLLRPAAELVGEVRPSLFFFGLGLTNKRDERR